MLGSTFIGRIATRSPQVFFGERIVQLSVTDREIDITAVSRPSRGLLKKRVSRHVFERVTERQKMREKKR